MAPVEADGGELRFVDSTSALGLIEPLTGMMGHAAGIGDINGDGWPDLVIGTFADRPVEDYQQRGASGPSPDRLLMGGPDGFQMDDGFAPPTGRTSGMALADLDRDGDLELVIGRNDRGGSPSLLYENRGGQLILAQELVPGLGARSIGVLDADADGLLDLFIVEDRWSGGSSVLLRNIGELRFVDVTASSGIPADVHGLGVGIADVTGDNWPDIFVSGANRLFTAVGDGTFTEAVGAIATWPVHGDEDDPAGVAIGDLNRDGRLDLVIGQHYNSTLDQGVLAPIHVYLNDGPTSTRAAVFSEVTDQAGLPGLPTKAPHVEIADFNNDGWPDILATASTDRGLPTVFLHQGIAGGMPQFEVAGKPDGPQYWVTGVSSDIDRDGRLDVILVEWDPGLPSLLLHNQSGTGHWLSVEIAFPGGSSLGSTINTYEAGKLGEPQARLGSQPVVSSTGFGTATTAAVRFGLGQHTAVDVEVVLPHGQGILTFPDVKADRHVRLPDGCT